MPGAEAGADRGGRRRCRTDPRSLLERIRTLEQRLTELESTTVLSEPETRVRRIEVYVDKDGNQYDQQVPGAKREVTYQRERVYRRQTINEKIEEALADAEGPQRRHRRRRDDRRRSSPSGRPAIRRWPTSHAYALASADLFFTARLAQNTIFFADIVALSGSPPDREIPTLTLLNGYTARLVNQNELNLREAWLRTEFFGQRLALTAGRLDLTNYFDHNAAANDETTQFLSDALVNNQMLGLSSNGTGVRAVFDPKNGFNFKFGLQQSNPDATNLSDSIYSLAEVGYTCHAVRAAGRQLPGLVPLRTTPRQSRTNAVGISLDQKLIPTLTPVRPRTARPKSTDGRDHFYSAGVQIQNGLVFNPHDTWGIGYAQIDPARRATREAGRRATTTSG